MVNVISVPNRPVLPVKREKRVFPIARIFGIGRNYSETAQSENKDNNLTVLFMKDAYMLSHADEGISYPNDTKQLRYEIELVVAIGKQGKNISLAESDEYIYGYAVGIDFTKYDVQEIAKQHAWPWDKGKSFEGCAPCSSITPKADVLLQSNNIWLKKNGIEVLILQAFNGHFEDKKKYVDNFFQTLKVFYSPKLNAVFGGYKTPLCTQKCFS